MRKITISLGFIIVLLLIWQLFHRAHIDEDGTEVGYLLEITGERVI